MKKEKARRNTRRAFSSVVLYGGRSLLAGAFLSAFLVLSALVSALPLGVLSDHPQTVRLRVAQQGSEPAGQTAAGLSPVPVSYTHLDVYKRQLEETVVKVADYSNHEKQKFARRMCVLFIIGTVLFTLYLVWCASGMPAGWEPAASCALGFAYGMMLVGILYTSGRLARFHALKLRLLKRLQRK